MRCKILLLLFMLMLDNFLFSQTLPGKFGFGADFGISILQGQSKPYIQPIGDAKVRLGIFDRLSLGGKFSGGWVGFRDRNTNDKGWTTVIAGELQSEFHIVPRSKADAYFFVSAGLINYNRKKDNYVGNTATVGFGLGLNAYIKHYLSFDFSVSYNLTTKGYFDNDPDNKKDGFTALKVGISYYFYDKEYIRQAYIRGRRSK